MKIIYAKFINLIIFYFFHKGIIGILKISKRKFSLHEGNYKLFFASQNTAQSPNLMFHAEFKYVNKFYLSPSFQSILHYHNHLFLVMCRSTFQAFTHLHAVNLSKMQLLFFYFRYSEYLQQPSKIVFCVIFYAIFLLQLHYLN